MDLQTQALCSLLYALLWYYGNFIVYFFFTRFLMNIKTENFKRK
jgi:hypothetical protein